MKKQIITLIFLLFIGFSSWAQKEYRIAKSSGKLVLNLNGALIEGYDGNEIIFSSQRTEEEKVDERAKGLQAISGSGLKDNTGLGVNVTENGQEVQVNLVGNNYDEDLLKIQVPKQLSLVLSYNKTMHAEPFTIKNMKGEIELSTTYNPVVLENNSGPMNIKTVYKSIDASFDQDVKGPVSLISVYDYVDVALPTSIKANLEMGTSYGKLYAADNFNIALTKSNTEEENDDNAGSFSFDNADNATKTVRTGTVITATASTSSVTSKNGFTFITTRSKEAENIKGTINGGGNDLIFKSTYKNVYLRTK